MFSRFSSTLKSSWLSRSNHHKTLFTGCTMLAAGTTPIVIVTASSSRDCADAEDASSAAEDKSHHKKGGRGFINPLKV
ncbi:hypothetical protein JCM3766R1_003033 [Sporobolomyces carnicolor]